MTPASTPAKTQAKANPVGGSPILEVHDLGVDFWVDGTWYPAAIDMNYDVHPGEVLAIVGESGSGKSLSLIHI